MNLQFYLAKLKESDEFRNFCKSNPDCFLTSGFFVIDKISDDNKQHFDFSTKEDKVFSFLVDDGCKISEKDNFSKETFEKINSKIDIDFSGIEELIRKRMGEENIQNTLQKIILSLQCINRQHFLVGTAFISGMGMINLNIDLEKMEIAVFEKKSFFDILRVKKKEKD